MKSSKNKLLIIILISLFSLSIILFVLTYNASKVSADVITKIEYKDKFSDNTLSDSWTTINNTETNVSFLDIEYNGLVFDANFDTYQGQVSFSKYVMTDSCKVEFITLCNGGSGWFAFSAGNKQTSSGMPYSSVAFVMAPNYAHIFPNTGFAIEVDESQAQYFSPVMEKYNGQLVKTTFDFRKTSSQNYYNIVYTVETLDGTIIGTHTYQNIFVFDGYFGLNAPYMDICVVSFKVFEDDTLKVDCNNDTFKTQSILFPSKGNLEAEWVVAQNYDEKSLKIGTIAKLNVSNVGTCVIYNKKYERPNTRELNELYDISADVRIEGMGVGVATGFDFGKAEASLQSKGTFAGITKDDKGKYYLVSFDGLNQKKVEIKEKTVDGSTMNLTVYYNNKAVISLGETSLEFDCKNCVGYFALTTLDFYNSFTGQKGAKLDNFVYKRNTYKDMLSKDMGINFEGTKSTYYESIGEYVKDFYINKQDWRISNNVIVPMYNEAIKDNSVTFTKINNYATFGPNYKYTNFIVRFDIKFLDNADDEQQPKFGLQFGMEETSSTIAESCFVGFQSYPTLTVEEGVVKSIPKSYVIAESARFTNGANIMPLADSEYNSTPKNIFIKGKTYNVMYVVKNGNVKVYLKEQSQSDSYFEVARAEIDGVDTQGYLQVLGTNRTRFEIDDFSIVNLDYNMTSTEYNGSDCDIIRSDFSLGDKLINFAGENVKYNNDTSLVINEKGYIESNTNLKNNIIRFKTKASSGDIVYEQGSLKVIFDKSGDKLSIISNNKVREFVLKEKIDFDGALIEITKMGNSVNVNYVNQKDPVICIQNNQFSVVADNTFEGNAKLYSQNGSLELYSMSVFDLKPKINIETRDYDASLDYIDPWTERTSIQELNEQGGCSSSISTTVTILPLLLFVAFPFILRRKKDEKDI